MHNYTYTNFTFSPRFLSVLNMHIANSLFFPSRVPSGLPRRGTVPGGCAIRSGCQSPFWGPSTPSSLLRLSQNPTRCRVGSCCLPGLGDDRFQSGPQQHVSRRVGGCSAYDLDQACRNIAVGSVGEVDRVLIT